MARNRKGCKVNKDAWLTTYSDMITLILVFFVLLYSMSSIDQEKYRMLVQAFTADPLTLQQLQELENQGGGGKEDQDGGTGGGLDQDKDGQIKDLDELYAYLKHYVDVNNLENAVQIEKGDNLVYVRFMSSLFFEADKAVLKSGGTAILDFVGKALGEVEPYIKFIRIDGHTAEAPGTSTVDNRELSTDRANAVLKYLENYYIQNPAKLMAVGYGLYRPVAPNDTEENRSKNRRVEILVAQEDALQDELDKLYNLSNSEETPTDNE